MTFNARLCAKNEIDFCTLTSTPAAYSTLPVTNLQNPRRGRIMRADRASTIQIAGTFNGNAKYGSVLMLDRHNLEPAATIRFRRYPNLDWTGSGDDTGNLAPYAAATLGSMTWGVDPLGSSIFDSYMGQKYTVIYFSRMLTGSFLLDITDTGNSAGVIDASRLFYGDYIEFLTNPQYGSTIQWIDNATQEVLAGGSLGGDAGTRSRHLEMDFQFIAESQRALVLDALRYAGVSKTIFYSQFPGEGGKNERDYTFLCKIFGQVPAMSLMNFQEYGLKIPLREA